MTNNRTNQTIKANIYDFIANRFFDISGVRVLKEHNDATIAVLSVDADGETLTVPAVIYHDGTTMLYSDWQAPPNDEQILDEVSDPFWGRRWYRESDGRDCFTVGGLPRVWE